MNNIKIKPIYLKINKLKKKFWEYKKLTEMNEEEWESLCDNCGKCCMIKLENFDTKSVNYTNISCKLLNINNIKCTKYNKRQEIVSDCVKLTPENLELLNWMPKTCAYRRIHYGQKLLDWHPLISKNKNSTIESGNSVFGKIISENQVEEEDFIKYLYDWE